MTKHSKYLAGSETAGKINSDWMANASVNGNVCDWFVAATNDDDCEISDDLSVWCGGRWMTQEEIDDTCAKIDRGV